MNSPSTRDIGRRWSSFSLSSARLQLTLRELGYGASSSRGVPLYATSFAGSKIYCLVKLEFHDADTDIDTDILIRILADMSDTRY